MRNHMISEGVLYDTVVLLLVITIPWESLHPT